MADMLQKRESMRLSDVLSWKKSLELVHDAPFSALTFDMRNTLPETLTYCGAATYLARSFAVGNVSAVITSRAALEEYLNTSQIPAGKGVLVSDSPKNDFFAFHNHLAENTSFYHRSGEPSIGAGCKISKFAAIDEHNVVIGDNVVIEDFVKIAANTRIGDNTIIRSGTVIGGDGFQFMRFSTMILKIAHAGGVSIGANVEMQANCMIDKHIFGGDTLIGDYAKLADGAHVAHCAKIGARTLLAAGAIVLGSTVVGDDVWVGPGAIISNEIDVGNKAFITLGAVVTRNVPGGEKVTGNFAVPHARFLEHLRTVR